VYVIRGNLTHPTIYWLDAKTPDALLLAEHFNLQSGDVLYVSSAVATRWNRVLNQLLPALQTVWYVRSITTS
jgi:polysaccharide biosynthesis/export protein